MDDKQLRRLRQFYHSLIEQQRVFTDLKGNPDQYSVQVLSLEFNLIQQEFPGLLQFFKIDDYFIYHSGSRNYYSIDGLRSYIGMAVGRLKVVIDQSSETPITEKREFTFINDHNLRKILERDFLEIQRAFISECWKSVIILCGSAIEAILTDLLLMNKSIAKSSTKAPKKPDITKWDLSDLIDVSVDLSLVSAGVEKMSHSIREYRNLVHPGNEIRNQLTFDAEEAKIALEVLNILYRDLKP